MDKYAVSYARLLNMSIKDSAFVETDLATIKLRNDVIAALQQRDQAIANYVRDGVASFYEEQFSGFEGFGPSVADKLRAIEVNMNHHACTFSFGHGGWKNPPAAIPGFEGVHTHQGNTEAALIGSMLDPSSIEQGDPT